MMIRTKSIVTFIPRTGINFSIFVTDTSFFYGSLFGHNNIQYVVERYPDCGGPDFELVKLWNNVKP